MPELPEVETIRRTLEPVLVGGRLEHAQFFRADIFHFLGEVPTGDLAVWAAQRSEGAVVSEIGRHGKVLSILFGTGHGWLIRLGMSGVLTTGRARSMERHTHVRWQFADGEELHYVDPRRFGRWIPVDREDMPGVVASLMGPDALDPSLDVIAFRDRLCHSQQGIKARLLDQKLLAGLGNIYCDEALFQAGLRFDRPCASLSMEEWERLYRAVSGVLQQGIDNCGTTLSDYRDGFGRPGRNQDQLKVYAQQGRPCPRCGETVCRIVYRGRGTHYCPACQW